MVSYESGAIGMHRLRILLGLLAAPLVFPTALSAQLTNPSSVTSIVAAQTEGADRPSVLLTRRTRETFAEIRTACERPEGMSDWTAVEWLLTTAQEHGWESELDTVTRQILAHPPESPSLRTQARAVRIVGCAQRGEAEAAVAEFEAALKGVRLRQPQEITNLAVATSLAFQLKGDIDAARAIYERLNSAFFLNTEVREFVTYRLNRLALLGKPAPEVALTDLTGNAVAWNDYRGKVTVLDFWATNCRPCLEELPRLRRFYQDRDAQRVELLGISLDEDVADIERLRQQEPLPWRIALDQKKATPAFQVVLIPCVIALDAEGKVAAVDIPPRSLRSTVDALLQKTPVK
jgi:peroxiredoxin